MFYFPENLHKSIIAGFKEEPLVTLSFLAANLNQIMDDSIFAGYMAKLPDEILKIIVEHSRADTILSLLQCNWCIRDKLLPLVGPLLLNTNTGSRSSGRPSLEKIYGIWKDCQVEEDKTALRFLLASNLQVSLLSDCLLDFQRFSSINFRKYYTEKAGVIPALPVINAAGFMEWISDYGPIIDEAVLRLVLDNVNGVCVTSCTVKSAMRNRLSHRKIMALVEHAICIGEVQVDLVESAEIERYSREFEKMMAKLLAKNHPPTDEFLHHCLLLFDTSEALNDLLDAIPIGRHNTIPSRKTLARLLSNDFDESCLLKFLEVFPEVRLDQALWIKLLERGWSHDTLLKFVMASPDGWLPNGFTRYLPPELPEDVYLLIIGRQKGQLEFSDLFAAIQREYPENVIRYIARRCGALEVGLGQMYALKAVIEEHRYSENLLNFIKSRFLQEMPLKQ